MKKENESAGGAPEADSTQDAAAEGKDESIEKKDKDGLKSFVDGTVRIATGVGSTLGEAFKGMAGAISGRDRVVMVRVNAECLAKIDQLVDAGIFKSRSESAAYLIARGIDADAVLFGKLAEKVAEINRLRGELKRMVVGEGQSAEGTNPRHRGAGHTVKSR